MISKESNFAKNDTTATNHHVKNSKPTSSTSWSRLKDPRIVRVSKAFGGKDRHSKVCTVRGLRDRRVRLSVPTAIQLYDLQDRLGLSQPSKVVDWLLNAAKHEIDELPPLQIPPGSFQQILTASQADHKQSNDSLRQTSRTNSIFGEKFRVCSGDRDHESINNWGRNDEENQECHNINFPSREALTTLMNMNNSISYNPASFARFDPSSLSLSTHPQESDLHNFGFVPMSTVPSGSHHQVLVYQPGMCTQPYFPSQSLHFDPKEVNFQSSMSSAVDHQHRHHTQPAVRPIHFMNMTASLLPSGNDEDSNDQRKGSAI